MKKLFVLLMALGLLGVLAACGGGMGEETAVSSEPMAETMTDQSDEAMANEAMAEEAMAEEPMADHNDNMAMEEPTMETMEGETAVSNMDSMAMMDQPAWQTIALTDAGSGESFTLADFAGKTVFVEPMATWCTNCRQQLNNVAQIREQFGDDVVFIGLSLETNLSNEELARYAADQGFDWRFAVMTPDMLQALADTFGRTITNAPSTPHFVIRADGTYTDLATGIDSPDQLAQFIQEAQS